MKRTAIAAVVTAALLSGCTMATLKRVEYEKNGDREHIRTCTYEADKSPQPNYSTRSSVGMAMEENSYRDGIFNACMKYLSGK